MIDSHDMPRASGVDIAGTGFTVLDRIYNQNRNFTAEELGGSCGNVLLSLALLERTVTPVLSLGDDEIGAKLVDAFKTAGAETAYIERRQGFRSPMIVEILDEASSEHTFSFECPETEEPFARYEPIGRTDVARAMAVLTTCSVFYADRVSDAIVEAMEAASTAGAIIYFEPSSIKDRALLLRALRVVDILKFSHDRITPEDLRASVRPSTICIATFGSAGLEVRQNGVVRWCDADKAEVVRDTCGSGDMVSVGVIDWLVRDHLEHSRQLQMDAVISGVRAGQRLAAANCEFIGARGIFRERGVHYVRAMLEGVQAG